MKLYFYRRTRYPAKEQPDYYNVTRGYAGYRIKQDDVCLFEGTTSEFEDYLDIQRPQRHMRKTYRSYN